MKKTIALDVAVAGLNRAVSINGPRIIIFHFPDHTVALAKKSDNLDLGPDGISQLFDDLDNAAKVRCK